MTAGGAAADEARPAVIRSGPMPPLADGFTARPQSAPDLAGLPAGAAVALVPAAADQPARSCGKTQLAVCHAQATCRSGQVELLAWVDAGSRASVLAGYVQAAAAAGTGTAGPAEHAAARLARWLKETSSRWLMVLDDLHDPADLDGIWPAGPAGQILITAPDRQAIGDLGAVVIPVGPFSPREALTYLMTRLAADPDQRHGAIDLALALDGDPVALAQASAVIATTGQSCRDYLARYTAARDRQAAQGAGTGPPAPAAATWVLSADRAGQLLPDRTPRLVLALTALLDGQPVPGPLLTAPAIRAWLARACGAHGPGAAWDAARALADCDLISIDPATVPIVRMNRPVAAMVRAAQPGPVLAQAALAAADALTQIWPQPESQPGQAAALRSCASALQRTAPDSLWPAGGPHPLLITAGRSLDAACLTGPAVRHWTQLVATSRRHAGEDDPRTLTAASRLAAALHAAGHPDQAAGWWQWVTACHARLSGPDHHKALAAGVELGRATAAAGQPGRAVTILQQAVAGHERACGPSHPGTVRARDALGAAYLAAGHPDQAIRHRQHNLRELESLHGAGHHAILAARDQLAAAYLAAGRPSQAVACYQHALTDRERLAGADHPDTITTRLHLATACQAAGKIAAALGHHDQARASYERTLGPAHPQTLACRAELAGAYHNAGHLSDATALLRDTLAQCEQALPPGHHLTQAIRRTLTSITSG